MKFSVVISTYNRLGLLQRAIDSALKQTLDCEVIVADDCSPDGTADYMQNLADKRVIYHRNAINQGHSATVNAGVAKATGDWIKFLDDDDYLAPNCLEEMLRAIELHPNAVICSCIAAQVDIQEVELSRTPQVGPGLAYYIPQSDIHYGMLLELVPFGTPAQVACCRNAFLQTGGWNSEFDGNCDDIDAWIHIAKFGDAIFLNQCLAYRTIWSGAYNQKFSLSQRMQTNILMKKKIYDLVNQRHYLKLPNFEDIKKYLTLHWILIAIREGNSQSFLKMLNLAIISPMAWKMELTAVLYRRSLGMKYPGVRKITLIESEKLGFNR